MIATLHSLKDTPEGNRVVPRSADLPKCDGLRACAALTSIVQYILVSKVAERLNLGILVQFGFAMSGFLITSFLLKVQGEITESEDYEAEGMVAWCRTLIRTIPVGQMIVVIMAVLYIPRLMALESFAPPDMAEVPAMIIRLINAYFADFQKPGFDGSTLLMWPLVIMLVPRRVLSMALLSVLGASLVMQFAGLFSGQIRPASMIVAPSGFDLLATGSFLAVIVNQGAPGNSGIRLSRWAILTGLVMALVMVLARFQGKIPAWGTVSLLSAPQGFGLLNFMLQIVATTLVSCLWWRDLGGLVDGMKRVPAA